MGQTTRYTHARVPLSAGIDVAKATLSFAVAGGTAQGCANTVPARQTMIAFLHAEGVTRVGLEATGVYHMEAAEELRAAGFEVVVFQPRQVKAYATFRLQRAKSDPIDAALIAACTAAWDRPRAALDPRLVPLAEHLTFIDQLGEDIARLKVRRERYRDPRLCAELAEEITLKTRRRKAEIAALLRAVRAHPDLIRRLELLQSIQGIGALSALVLVIRMPELGTLTREQAASLLGVAPFVHESGRYKGQRRTGGGRARARTSLFAAVQAACRRWNPPLIALYDRLTASGKPHAVAVVACLRKMIVFANTILTQDRPWITHHPEHAS
jgi:transposase